LYLALLLSCIWSNSFYSLFEIRSWYLL